MIKLTKKHHIEAGIVAGLLLMIAGYFTGKAVFFKLTFAVLILSLSVPGIFYPFTYLWFNLSRKLSLISSTVLMTLIYIILVVPVSFIRRISGKDTLLLRKFKEDRSSVFTDRNLTFTSEHIDKTY